jgi:hypothetical protein
MHTAEVSFSIHILKKLRLIRKWKSDEACISQPLQWTFKDKKNPSKNSTNHRDLKRTKSTKIYFFLKIIQEKKIN